MKKELIFILLVVAIFLAIPLGTCVEVIQVQPPTQQQPASPFKATLNLFKSKVVWGIIGILLLVILFGVGAFFLVRWAIKFIKIRSDIFYQIRTEKLKLAKAQRSYPSKAFLKYKKNTPIRLVRMDGNGKPHISNPVAYHRGDYVSHEGNLIIAFNMQGNHYLFIIPRTELLIIPNRKEIKIMEKDKEGKPQEVEIKNIPTAKELVQFNENEILIYADSICSAGNFYVPVIKTEDNKVIDMSIPVYYSLREVALGNLLYEQTDEFSKVAKKSIDLNPNLRWIMKSGDTNQSIEVPTGNK